SLIKEGEEDLTGLIRLLTKVKEDLTGSIRSQIKKEVLAEKEEEDVNNEEKEEIDVHEKKEEMIKKLEKSIVNLIKLKKLLEIALKYRGEINYITERYDDSNSDLHYLLKVKSDDAWAKEILELLEES
ncbi:24912_t:CDS:2, partial [Gigaspora rosea]